MTSQVDRRPSSRPPWILLGLILAASAQAAQGAGDPPAPPVARAVSADATLLRREAEGKPWRVLANGEALPAGGLVLGLPGAALESQDGAIRLSLRSDLSGTGPFPIVETAVGLLPPAGADLAFRLDRGRVELANRKTQGAARAHVVVGDATADVVLQEPGARVAFEMFGRWPAGAPFTKDPRPGDGPTLYMVILVLHGEVGLKMGGRELALRAPPGPAMVQWDSVNGADAAAEHLDKPPAWATDDPSSEVARKKQAVLDEFRDLVRSQSVPAAVEAMLNSDDPVKRRLAVIAMGALDDLRGLARALANAKHADVWDNGVLTLRHWIGRGPGQDQKLYHGLIREKSFTPVQAESVIQLLHGFSNDDLAHPETFQTLIADLTSDKLAIRGLAYWHLHRLVPEGRKFGYNALDPKEKRDRAAAEWDALMPGGRLPERRSNGK